MADNHHKIIIIGSGPAGFTAALYTARANLKPVIFEGMQPGGQLTITTEVENYPGFEHGIQGPALMDIMRKQVHRFGTESFYKEITEVDFSKRPFVLKSYNEVYTADAVIVATGASAKLLGLESEKNIWVTVFQPVQLVMDFSLKIRKLLLLVVAILQWKKQLT